MPIAEPYLCANLSFALQAAGNKQAAVRAEAEKAVSQICKNMSANAVSEVLKYLFAATDVECNWQTRALALKMIASFGDHAPEQLGFALPEVIITITYFPIFPMCNSATVLLNFIGCPRGDQEHVRYQAASQRGRSLGDGRCL